MNRLSLPRPEIVRLWPGFPIAEAFRKGSWPIVFTMFAFVIGTAGFYFTNTFLIAYTTRTLGVDRTE